MKRRLLALVIVAALALAACSNSAGLSGRPWKLVKLNGVATNAEVGITFGADGRYSAHLGCNTGSGSWRLDGSQLSVSDVARTMAACGGSDGVVEDVFVAVLKGGPTVTKLETSSGTLILTGGIAKLEFTTP